LELAGEITDAWPDKEVTIVEVAGDILAGEYLDELRDSLRVQLHQRGVRLLVGHRLADEPGVVPGVAGPISCSTTSGVDIEADLWFRCFGMAPSTDYLSGDLAGARRPDGLIEVDEFLRVRGHRNIFAIGDVTSVPESKRAGAAQRHAQIVADNIRSLVAGTAATSTYHPMPPYVMIPLGSAGGATHMHGPDGARVMGAEFTAEKKGRDLMIDRYTALFNASAVAT
jgi:NADH dehydrogenase FAD-containing subunit